MEKTLEQQSLDLKNYLISLVKYEDNITDELKNIREEKKLLCKDIDTIDSQIKE